MSNPFHFFGIRHHGPACARSLLEALSTLKPDCILIEGPPDAQAILPLAIHQEMKPPIALLVYAPEQIEHAVFYPFADFSPEWQAIRYGMGHKIDTQLMDLPHAHRFAIEAQQKELKNDDLAPLETTPISDHDFPIPDHHAVTEENLRQDPLNWLAQTAGYADGETWWNHLIEENSHTDDIFAAVAEAMTALRESAPVPVNAQEGLIESLREAYMRTTMYEAKQKGYQRIAVVCGAWHVPALVQAYSKKDKALLAGLPKQKVQATWVPWTYERISRDSGYGAGITSPQWYEHLWKYAADPLRNIRWLAKVASVFRQHDIDCSSAHIIEAARFADALAAIRLRQQAGLDELLEAVQTVICMGEISPLKLIEKSLIIGDDLGNIPADSPVVPLQHDLNLQQKQLRLKPEALPKVLDLDLRKPQDLAKSELIHRLVILDIHWGTPTQQGISQKTRGTFHEVWQLQWQPEMVIQLIEKSAYGSTIHEAADHFLIAESKQEEQIDQLANMIQLALWADLPIAVTALTNRLSSVAAVETDVTQFLKAIPPLVSIIRYGNVRQTDTNQVGHVVTEMIIRVEVGLIGACAALDDDAAIHLYRDIKNLQQALNLLFQVAPDLQSDWHNCLLQLSYLGQTHRLISGLATRFLFDDQSLEIEKLTQMMQLALSQGHQPEQVAAWLEGFLSENAIVLLHNSNLWTLLDTWLIQLQEDSFTATLPLLRRAFGGFSPTDRYQLGQRAKADHHNQPNINSQPQESHIDKERAELCFPILAKVLGLNLPVEGAAHE